MCPRTHVIFSIYNASYINKIIKVTVFVFPMLSDNSFSMLFWLLAWLEKCVVYSYSCYGYQNILIFCIHDFEKNISTTLFYNHARQCLRSEPKLFQNNVCKSPIKFFNFQNSSFFEAFLNSPNIPDHSNTEPLTMYPAFP